MDSVAKKDWDEVTILSHPWALDLMQKMDKAVQETVLQWCSCVIRLGSEKVPVDEWTSIFSGKIENVYEDLVSDAWSSEIKDRKTNQELLATLDALCRDLCIEVPKLDKKKSLLETQGLLMRINEEYKVKRKLKVKELDELRTKQMQLCKALEKEHILLNDSSTLPTKQELDCLKSCIQSLEGENFACIEKCSQLRKDIIVIMEELKLVPTLCFEKEQLDSAVTDMLNNKTCMKQLETYHQDLCKERKLLKEEIFSLKIKIDSLWELLDEDIKTRDAFWQKYRGNSLQTLEALKLELERLEKFKKINIKMVIDKTRQTLVNLWEKCHCDGSQKNDFQFLYSISYSEDLLGFHENELQNWTNYYENNKELLTLLEKHTTLWEQIFELENSAECANRYKNRGGRLLLEEKDRNKLSKKIPELEERICSLATLFERKMGCPFKTFGRTIDEYMKTLHNKREEVKKFKLCTKKTIDVPNVQLKKHMQNSNTLSSRK